MNRRGSTIDYYRSRCKGRWAHPLYIHTYITTVVTHCCHYSVVTTVVRNWLHTRDVTTTPTTEKTSSISLLTVVLSLHSNGRYDSIVALLSRCLAVLCRPRYNRYILATQSIRLQTRAIKGDRQYEINWKGLFLDVTVCI
jgi:hypothetical protein